MLKTLLIIQKSNLKSSIKELDITIQTVKQFENDKKEKNDLSSVNDIQNDLRFLKNNLLDEYSSFHTECEFIQDDIQEERKQFQQGQSQGRLQKTNKKSRRKLQDNLEEQKRKFNYIKKFRDYIQQKHEKEIQLLQQKQNQLTEKKQKSYQKNLDKYFTKNNLDKQNYEDTFVFSQLTFEIFSQIKAEYLKTGDTIPKSMIIYYFLMNTNLLKLFDIYPQELIEEILNFEGIEPNSLCDNDLCQILSLPRQPIDLNVIQRFRQQNPYKKVKDFFIYFYLYEQQQLEDIQQQIESYQSRKRSGIELIVYQIEEFLKDYKNLDDINQIVFYIHPINKIITLSHLLLQYRQKIIDDKIYNDKEEIEQDFKNFVLNFKLNNKKKFYDLSAFMSYKNNQQDNFIRFKYMDVFKQIFKKLPNNDGYVNKDEFFVQIKNNQFLEKKMNNIARKTSEEDQELLHELLDRIDQESDEYINYDEFEQYFTQRGYPIFTLKYYVQRNKEDIKNNNESKKIYLWTLPNSKARKEHLRKIWTSKHFEKVYGKNYLLGKLNKDLKVTIPNGLKLGLFQDKVKYFELFQDYLKDLKEQDIQKEINYKFKAKPVPKNIYKAIYQNMNDQEKFKKEQFQLQKDEIENQRRELIQQKEDDDDKEQEYIVPVFKARKMPKYCDDGLYQELVQDKIDERKDRKLELKELLNNKKEVPFYAHMPKRFQNYAKKQHQKQLYYRNMSADKYDPECTFLPKISKKIDQSYKEYITNKQDKFQQKALKKQAEIVNEMQQDYDQKYKPFNFQSNFLKKLENPHNCEYTEQKVDKPFVYDYKKILYNDVTRPLSTLKFEQMKQKNLQRKNKIEVKKRRQNQRSNSCDSFYEAEIISGGIKNQAAEYLVRNILIPKEDFENCHYDLYKQFKKEIKFLIVKNFYKNFRFCKFNKFLINIQKTYAETKYYRRFNR